MANEIFLTSNEKFHVFSKSPITPSMGLAQAVNKSGHTTTTADVWSQDIPWFFSADDQATALVTGKDAKYNDLVLIGSNVFKRNKTAYSEGAAFGTLWEPFTLADKTKLYNSDEKHVLTYHKGAQVEFLTTGNNAKQASNYAGRIFINGKVVEQFVASTDKISGGVPSTGYGVAVYNNKSPLSEGEAEANFIANSYAGIIQFNKKVGPSTAYTADVFEYVGEKLSTTVSSQATDIKGAQNDISLIKAQLGLEDTTPGGTPSVTTRVEAVEGKVEKLETVTIPAIQQSVTAAQSAAEKTAKEYTDGQITTVNDTITSTKTELEGKITTAETLANTKIKEVKKGTASDLLSVETSNDKVVTITLSGDVATKSYADTAAANAVSTSLSGTTDGTIGKAIADAKKEALEAVEAIQHFSVSVVDSLPSAPVANTIYLVPEEGVAEGTYIEYIAYKPADSETVVTEKIGSTKIDLSEYAKTADVTTSIGNAKTELEGKITAVTTTANGNAASIKTITEETIPAIQQSVTNGVADAKSHAETKATEALNTAKGYTDSQITAELGEGGEIATKIAAAQTAATTAAKTYTDTKIADELKDTGSIGKAIEAAKQAAISQAEVTITAGTGIVVTGEGKGTTFEIAVDSSVATAQSVTELTNRVKANEDSLAAGGATALAIEGAKSAAQKAQTQADKGVADAAAALAEAQKRISKVSEGTESGLLSVETNGTEVTITLDDDVATKTHVTTEIGKVNSSITTTVSTLEGKITAAHSAATAAQNSANTAQQTADAKVASVTGGNSLVTVSGDKNVTITVSDTIATKSYADSKASAALTDAKTYTNTELGKLSAAAIQTVTGDTYVKATKTDTTVTLETQLSALDTALAKEGTSIATAIAAAKKAGTDASAALEAAKTQIGKDIAAAKSDVLGTTITEATGKDAETSPKVTVELSGTVQSPSLKVTTDDIASAQELATLKQTVTDKNVATSANAQAVGVTASNNTVDVDVATYTNKTWAKKTNLVTGSAVESAVSDAKSDVLGTTITATGKDADTAPKVTVQLSGSVQTPSLTVTTADIASAKALSELETKVDNFHKAGVSYQVLTELPAAGKDYNGVIVLVPETANDDTTAVAGSYVEHLCVNKGTEDAPSWVWEKIGTTKAEFANYYTKTEVDSEITAAIDALDSDASGAGIKVELTNGKVTNVSVTSGAVEANNTSVVTGGVVHTAISTAITTAIDALDKTTGSNGITLTQTNGVASIAITPGSVETGNTSVVTGGDVYDAVSVKANSTEVVASINGISNSGAVVLAVNEASAGTGLSIATEGENITITDSLITAWVPTGATSVHCNVATVGDTQTLINPEKFTTTPETISSTITSWVADMPNLNNGKNMFFNCASLRTFIGDLSSLENGNGMFSGCSKLMNFIGDLSSLKDGYHMFYGCMLTIDCIEDIADSINNVKGSETSCVFDIGGIVIPLEDNLTETVKQRYRVAIDKIKAKGWGVESNGETPSLD